MNILKGDETIKVPAVSEDKARAFVFKTVSEEHVGEINYIRLFSGTLKGGEHLKNMTTGNEERLGSLYSICGNKREEVQELQAGDIGGLIKLKETRTSDTLVDPSLDERFEPIDYGDRLVMTAVKPVNTDDDDKINTGFRKLNIEDPLFEYNFYPDIRQSILSGMGDMHLKIVLEALKRRFKVDVETVKPKISYRETITKKVEYVEYTHKKQSGGAGQFARVFIDLEPAKRGEGYEFEDKIVGGVIDQPLRPSVDKGIQAIMHNGIFAGYPIVDVKVSLVDGKTHPVDSKDVAFQIAGREVFKKAFLMANPILLEPIDDITVVVPEEYMGDIMGDMSSRRGKISGMTPEGDMQVIKAQVPAAEILEYSQSLRSMSQGRGYYTRSFSHYEKVPEEIAEKVKEESRNEGEEE